MSKTNFFVKYLKIISNFINSLLEKNLNKLNFKNLKYLLKNNKIVLTFVALFMVFIIYLLLPTLHKQSAISVDLQTKLQKKFNVDFKFSKNLRYNFFPRPHFTTTETLIFDDQIEISKVNKLKIFVSVDKLFSLKNIEIRDIIFENANFQLDEKNYNFFINLLDKNFKNGNLIIKNSNIFFRSSNKEILFINKILELKYQYEPIELRNIIYAENEIFNIPFSISSYFNTEKKKFFSLVNLDLMKLKIQNELLLRNEIKVGKSELVYNNLKRFVNYEINKNAFRFDIFDKIDQPNIKFEGNLNFKPFYAGLNGTLKDLNLNHILESNALVVQLLKSEILNNKNIDFKLNIKSDNIYNNSNFKNININFKIQEGLIDTDESKFNWKDFAFFELKDSLIFVKDGELVLDGKLKIKINDYKNIYKFLLTPKNYRNEINEIDLNFTYNFDQKIAELKDIKVDNKYNTRVNEILDNIILKKGNLQNKIYFKNLLNKAIKGYSG